MTYAYNRDCMEAMKEFKDKHFELAIVDPEYRDDNQPDKNMRKSGTMKHWKGAPKQNYFDELFRISKEQIIFGGNYFTTFLPPNNNWFVWYKNNDGLHMSMAELAWISIRKNVKVLDLRPHGLNVEWHPTAKPIKLYRYLLDNYAKPGDKILDTHLGSGSSRIAAHQLGYEFYGYELDAEYFAAQEKRFSLVTSQQQIKFGT
jgi:site-specific DNA-methyltransferase (adenine-specific)